MDDENVTIKLTKHDEEIKSLKHRMDKQEEQSNAINDLALSVKELAINMNIMKDNQEDQGKRLAELESKPAKRWEQVVTVIITTVVGALVGYMLAKVGLGG